MTELIGRVALAIAATSVAITFLLNGIPLGAVAVIAIATLLRRSIERRVHAQTVQ
jgi:hypothetical protein